MDKTDTRAKIFQEFQVDKLSAIEQKRADERKRRLLKAQMVHPRHGRIDVVIRDVSAQGVGGKCNHDLLVGEAVTICLPGNDPVPGQIAWRAKGAFGVSLDHGIDPTDVRNSSDVNIQRYQAPERAMPAGDFKRPGFGRNKRG